jgi:peptide-methionine (S)-S-oxide reductase
MEQSNSEESIILAGGCFWCIEAVLKRLKGVIKLQNGYIGGHVKNPTYKEVCSGTTGHAEAVEVIFNPQIISLNTVLDVFFSMHDPTTLNRQVADIGTQYRSAVFYQTDAQKEIVEGKIRHLENDQVFNQKIVTELSKADIFYPAESYHDNYYDLNREQNSYCTAVIDPKVNKLRKSYAHLLSD